MESWPALARRKRRSAPHGLPRAKPANGQETGPEGSFLVDQRGAVRYGLGRLGDAAHPSMGPPCPVLGSVLRGRYDGRRHDRTRGSTLGLLVTRTQAETRSATR